MRSREEIEEERDNSTVTPDSTLMLEVLLDIRDLLNDVKKLKEKQLSSKDFYRKADTLLIPPKNNGKSPEW